MTKLGDKLSDPGYKSGDDYLHHNCVICGEPRYEEVENDDGKMIWLCDEHYWIWVGLSPCCGAEPDPMFPNSKVCSVCKEHF